MKYETVSEHLTYDPDTGLIYRKKSGKSVAVKIHKGYLYLTLKGKQYSYHRVAWLLHYRELPDNSLMVDHIDRNPKNNRLSNLRAATRTLNCHNTNLTTAKSGFRGVHNYKGKWIARLSLNKKVVFYKTYPTIEEASNGYEEAKRKFIPEAFDYERT
jgi:hypothetical protein